MQKPQSNSLTRKLYKHLKQTNIKLNLERGDNGATPSNQNIRNSSNFQNMRQSKLMTDNSNTSANYQN